MEFRVPARCRERDLAWYGNQRAHRRRPAGLHRQRRSGRDAPQFPLRGREGRTVREVGFVELDTRRRVPRVPSAAAAGIALSATWRDVCYHSSCRGERMLFIVFLLLAL